MFTNNYGVLRHNMFWGTYSASNAFNGVSGRNYKNAAGNSFNQGNGDPNPMTYDIGAFMHKMNIKDVVVTLGSSSGVLSPGIYLGSGSTPAQATDINLESPIKSGITATFIGKGSIKEADGKYAVFSQFVLKNTTDSDINIYEVGYFSNIGKTNAEYYLTLMERTVFSKPITIPAGESKFFTYKITFNQVLNVE